MRSLEVYKAGHLAGVLAERSRQCYEFIYDKQYVQMAYPPISVTLLKRTEPYHSEVIFPFFMNMLPEGVNRRTICRIKRIDENDYFGLLMAFADKDIIGDITFKILNK